MLPVIRSTIVANCLLGRQSRSLEHGFIREFSRKGSTIANDKNNVITDESLTKSKGSEKDKSKFKIDRSKVPTLHEKDLEEHFVSGSGPGGQSVNKAVNCCQLRHLPTGFTIKVHHTRSLETNRKIARELMVEKLDHLYNGENSVSNQKKRKHIYEMSIKQAQKERLRELKMNFINRDSSKADG